MTKNQEKSKTQKGSKKPTSTKKPTSNSSASYHQPKSTSHYPPFAKDNEEENYPENHTQTLDPETRVSTPSYISYTDTQAPDYRRHPTWNHERDQTSYPACQTYSGQVQVHNTTCTQPIANHTTPQAQSYTPGPASASYLPQQPASSAPYQLQYPPTTEYPCTIPQLDSWFNETETSNMPFPERFLGRHYA